MSIVDEDNIGLAEQSEPTDVGRTRGDSVDDVIERILGQLNGHGITVPLADLFTGLGRSFEQLSDNKSELRAKLTPFLFDHGQQRMDLVVLKDGGLQFPADVEENIDKSALLEKMGPGELESHVSFYPDQKHKGKANSVHGMVRFGGMPMLGFIVDVIRSIISESSRTDLPQLKANSLLNALKRVFPSCHGELAKFVRMDETEINIEYVSPGDQNQGAIVISIGANIDLKELRRHYETVENLLSHIKEMEFSLLDGTELPQFQHKTHEQDKEFNDLVERTAEESPEMLRFAVHSQRDICSVRACICLSENSDELVYMYKGNEMPFLEEDEETGKRIFRSVKFSIQEPSKYLALINFRAKILELGCATLSLPTLYVSFVYDGQDPNDGSEGFTAKLLHMGSHGRATSYLLRPFINIDTLRYLLMSTMEWKFTITPKPCNEGGAGLDDKVGDFHCRFFFTILRPRSVVVKCMTFFLKHQISQMHIVDLLGNVFTTLGNDLQTFSVRGAQTC